MAIDWKLKNICTGEEIKIIGDVFRVGRSSNFEIVCLSKNVSREHAEFTIESGNLYVQDMKSANGTYVNSKRTIKKQLKHGDIVSLGIINHSLLVNNSDPQYSFKVIRSFEEESTIILDEIEVENENVVQDTPTQHVKTNNCVDVSLQEKNSNQLEIKKEIKIEIPDEFDEFDAFANFCEQIKTEPADVTNVSAVAGYSIEDDVIIIQDDEDCCDFSSSQLFTTTVNPTSAVDDGLFTKIKTELEELDRDENERVILIDDSDSESDWFNIDNITAQIRNLEEELSKGVKENSSGKVSSTVVDDALKATTSTNDAREDDNGVWFSKTDVDKLEQELWGKSCKNLNENYDTTEESNKISKLDHKVNEDTSKSNELLMKTSVNNKSKYVKPPVIEATSALLCKSKTKLYNATPKVLNAGEKHGTERKDRNENSTRNSTKRKGQNENSDRNSAKRRDQNENSGRNSAKRKDQNENSDRNSAKRKDQNENSDRNSAKRKDQNENSARNNTKRKSQGEDFVRNKKPKLKNTPGNRNKRSLDVVDKDEKAKIKQMRKKKLKEIESKNPEKDKISIHSDKTTTQIDVNCRSIQANVKVSDSRGNFLLDIGNQTKIGVRIKKKSEKIESAVNPKPSTSKQMNIEIKNGENNKKNTRDPRTQIPEEKPKEFVKLTDIPQQNDNKRPLVLNTNNNNNNNSKQNRRNMILSMDTVMNIISWKSSWLEEQQTLIAPPPVNHRTAVKMCNSFSSISDYCNIVNALLTLELWNSIYKTWANLNDETRQELRKFRGSIESVEVHSSHLLLRSTTYITKQQNDNKNYAKEGDVMLINVPLLTENQLVVKRLFAYVQGSNKKSLHANDYIDSCLAKQLSSLPDSAVSLDIMIKRVAEKVCVEKYIEGGILMSLISPLREFNAVKSLGRSPLCKYILDPRVEDYLVPNVCHEKIIVKNNLSEIQQQVVSEAVTVCLRDSPGIYLIQGPPGTGKTTVITSILQNLVFNEEVRDMCILLVAPSNAAVDGIILKINKEIKPHLTEHQRRKIKLIRIGPQNSIHDEVKPYFLDEIVNTYVNNSFFSHFPEVCKDYHQLCKDKENLSLEIKHDKESGRDVSEQRKKELQELTYRQENFAKIYLKQNYYERFFNAKKIVVEGANIICTTLSSCVRLEELDLFGKITCCIVDEATQSNEPETLIPLMLGVKKLILVGDPQQLPAVTVSQHAKELGHGQSLFARIKYHFDNKPLNPIRMLNVQFRMHPEISRFPNINFYHGKLLNSPTYSEREGLDKLAAYYVFNLNSKSYANKGYTNEDEVDCVIKLLNAIRITVGDNLSYSVGIITPYNTQKAALNKRLVGYSENRDISIAVNTVDSFQGTEKDIIILSCVRVSPNSFLSNEQRLNVAITRAKSALYIIGTYSLFQHCAMLNRIKKDAEKRNLYININCNVNTALLQALITSK